MKVTTRKLKSALRTNAQFWEVLVDGKRIGGGVESNGIVILAPREGYFGTFQFGQQIPPLRYATLEEAANYVAAKAVAHGLL